jgi:small-conductance mechanosensitive channel
MGEWMIEPLQTVLDWLALRGLVFTGPNAVWTLMQLIVIAGSYGLATWLAGRSEPPLEAHLRRIKGNPRLLRMLAVPLRQLKGIIFLGLLWAAVLMIRSATWPSRSHLIAAVASLVTAWVVIAIASRVVRNRLFARIVAVVAWSAAALNILGLLPQTIDLLDSVAIELQDFRLSPLLVIKAAIILTLLVWLAVAGGQFLESRVRASDDLTPTLKELISKLIRVGLLAFALLWGLSAVGIDFTVLAVFSGAVGLGLGFGLQKVVSNLVSGFILLLDKSAKPGDVITVGDTFGTINAMNARCVSVIARDGREYLIPNEDLITSLMLNWSYSSDLVRLDLRFGTSYASDPHLVRRLAIDTAGGHPRIVAVPKPVCHIVEFGDSAIEYVLRFWIRDPSRGVTNVKGDVYLALWDAFKTEGIKIPFPHRELVLRQPVEVKAQKSRRDIEPG